VNTIFTPADNRYGYDFISGPEIPPGEDEYYLRNRQLRALSGDPRRVETYRPLSAGEIDILRANRNTCGRWEDLRVRDPFDPSLIRDCSFAGLVRLGTLERGLLHYHDYTLPAGITRSRIISCDIGDHCAVHDCSYMSHYLIGDGVILSGLGELDATNHAKFGEGILKTGESEDLRIWIDPLNETGGRGILPFRDLIPGDAYLWTVYREDQALMEAFKRITQNSAGYSTSVDTPGEESGASPRGYYGIVGPGSVIKHCLIIKDTWIGEAAYIKGAHKLKNLTIKSDPEEPTQIGEGVELINGIIGYGCRVFYGSKAVRFVLGNNCNLKYGARLIHSILGDNSTVSCCEILNNLVFPFHEQHHNNSFLIATLIQGQSNMAAGATVGSNHNSRGNDGEIIAGRGFWPGLSSTLKHNCRFASFVLIAKGSYPVEMNIPLPFSLVTTNSGENMREVMPAYYWLYNLYALERNSWKFSSRDKRHFKEQHIETDYLAPDTAGEILRAMSLLEAWAGRIPEDQQELIVKGRVLERSNQGVKILKPGRGYQAYRDMLLYYGVKTLVEYLTPGDASGDASGTAPGVALGSAPGGTLPVREADRFASFQAAHPGRVSLEWLNLGGQLVPQEKAQALMEKIRRGRLRSWQEIHREYDTLWAEYPLDKALNALEILRFLEGSPAPISPERWNALLDRGVELAQYIAEEVYRTKLKDYNDPFRSITYRNNAERDAVLGPLEKNPFVTAAREAAAAFSRLARSARSRGTPI